MEDSSDLAKGCDPIKLDRTPENGARSIREDASKDQDVESGVDEDLDDSRPISKTSVMEPLPMVTAGSELQSKSRSSSVRPELLSVVPRSQRRGLLARFAIIPEVDKPTEYSHRTKWLITLFIALAGAAALVGSAIFYPALPQLSHELHSTPTIVNLSVAMYMLSMSISPLWWSSFSETLGRRSIYLVSFVLFVIFSVLCAVSTSIGMLIAMRILGGGAAASVQAVGAGTIADIWEPKERGKAMGIFYLGPLMGPLLAPIIGGVLAETFGWRSTMWFLAIYGGVLLILLTICLPETLKRTRPFVTPLPSHNNDKELRPQLARNSTARSFHKQAAPFAKVLKRCIVDPLFVLAYLRFPAVAITVYYASITYGSLYVLNISIQQTFSREPYGFSTIIIGLLYIPGSVGYMLASVLGGKWSDKIMHREARAANRYDEDGQLLFQPEDRMRENAYLAALIYPGALLWYGWTVQYHLHWAIPVVANFFFAIGSMVIFSLSATMLTEFVPKRSSSGVAVNNFARNIFSCVGGTIASPLIDVIGNGWLFTGLAVTCWFSMAVVWAMGRFGPGWRAKMNVAMNG